MFVLSPDKETRPPNPWTIKTSIGLPTCGLPSAEFQSGNRVGHGNQLGIAFHPEHRFTKDKEPVGTLPLFSVWYVSPIVTTTPCDTFLKKKTVLVTYIEANDLDKFPEN
jgi:hypothetical protein